ncbi:MAG: hypothetical protein M9949_03685 [Candidatus Kapabacteria bacterium]|nr:hypothetical protein [Candidatus Kapabacteria bacterium]
MKQTIVLLLFAIALLGSCSKHSEYKIVDYFTDSTDRGKFVFLFVETDTIIQDDILNWTKEFKSKDTIMRVEHDSILHVLISYFYIPDVYDEIPEEQAVILREKYKNPEITNKLLLAKNGAVYTGFSKITEGMPFPKDTVILTSVFVPKKGYKAVDILKQRDEND